MTQNESNQSPTGAESPETNRSTNNIKQTFDSVLAKLQELMSSDNAVLTTDNKYPSWGQETKKGIINGIESSLSTIKSKKTEVLKMNKSSNNNNNSRSYKLDSNTPIYHGRKDEDLTRWIRKINNGMMASGVPEDRQIYVISNYVKESAENTLLAYQQECKTSGGACTFKDFSRRLIERVNNKVRMSLVKSDLLSLKQGENFEDFRDKFERLAIESKMPEIDLIFIFQNALKSKVKFELVCRKPGTPVYFY